MERTGTIRNESRPLAGGADEAVFSLVSQQLRQGGNSNPHNPPKGGCVGFERPSPQPTTKQGNADKAEWVKTNLPTCAAVAAEFRAAFGEVRLAYASENGHEIGTRSPDGVKMSETNVGSMALKKQERK